MTDTLEGFPQCASVLRVEDLPPGLPKEPVRCLKMDGHTDSHGAKNLGWPATYESDALAAHARTDVPALVAALEAVLELHKPIPENNPFPDTPASPWCLECGWEVSHPCPTVEVINKALGNVVH